MKTWGSWARVVASISVVAVVGSLLMVIASRHAGKDSLQSTKTPSPTRTSRTAGLAQASENPKWIEAYGKLPLSFEENQGQTAHEVRYVSHGSGYELFLTPQEAVLALRPNEPRDLSPLHRAAFIRALREARRASQMTVIRMHLDGANPEPKIVGIDPLPTKVNYFIGNDPKKWHTDVSSYSRVKYAHVYPGVDLVFYGNQSRLEYDFIVAPGADPEAIALNVDGARKMHINSRGDLVLNVPGGEVVLQKPVIYQNVDGERREIAGRYAIAENHRITFVVASYDRSEPLIVDPVLNYSTYLGGSSNDVGFAIAVDVAGDAFVAGQTMSTDFPAGTHGAVIPPPTTNSGATFVAELNPAGTQLLYSTYLAGTTTNAGDGAFGIAVDPSGKVYVTGSTFATNFPTTLTSLKPGPLGVNTLGTAFVTKLDPTASGNSSLVYSTYLGGTGGEFGNAIAADAAGNAYIVGITHSANFPTMNAFQSAPKNAFGTGFLTRIDTTKSDGASLIYSTYLGGTAAHEANVNGPGYGDQVFGVAADSSNNAYLVGTTTSTDSSFITAASAFQSAPPSGNLLASAFLSRIDTTKSANASLIYSTYLAGSTEDLGFAIALGPNNVAYATGTTNSVDFPHTTGAFQTVGAASGNAFVSLVDTTQALSASLKYSTLLGGTGGDTGFGIRADSQSNAYVAGTTASNNFPFPPKSAIIGGFEPTFPSGAAGVGFLAKLNPTGNGTADLVYSTYFGGTGKTTAPAAPDQIFAIAIDSSNPANAYVTGQTFSSAASPTPFPVFPTTAPTAFQTTLNGTSDAFAAKLTPIATLGVAPKSLNFGTVVIGTTSAAQMVTLTNNTNAAIAFTSAIISGGNPAAANNDYVATSGCGASIAAGASCTVSVTFKPSVAAAETATLVLTDGDSTSAQNIALTGTGANPTPAVGLAPTSLSFGNQLVNTTSAAQTVTLTNTGTGPLTINSIAASGDFAQTSTGATACPITPATLAVGANCTISVTFTPTAAGARSGTLTITDNAAGSPHTVPLTGTGTNPAVGLAPMSLSFGNQLVNTTSAAQTVTLTNTGTGPLTINSIAASGDFAQTSTGATACPITPATLAVGANCTISVTFTPTAAGARIGTLTITDNASGSPHTVSLTGTGTTPVVGLAPTTLTFGNQQLNTTSPAQTVTLTNTGTGPLTIISIAASGDFAKTSACPISPATLAAGANCTISVTFTPTAAGARAGTLTITDNAAGNPHTVTLTGTGTNPPDFGLTGPTTTQNVTAGSTLNFNVTMTPMNGFTGTVALTCTGAPNLSTCTVTPTSVAAANGTTAQTAQVSLATTAFMVPPARIPTPPVSIWQVVPVLLAMLLLFLLPRTQQMRMRFGMVTAMVLLLVLAGCGGGKAPGTPKGPATLTITGTSTTPALTHSVMVNISVN